MSTSTLLALAAVVLIVSILIFIASSIPHEGEDDWPGRWDTLADIPLEETEDAQYRAVGEIMRDDS